MCTILGTFCWIYYFCFAIPHAALCSIEAKAVWHQARLKLLLDACRDPATGATSPGLGRRIALDTARGLHFLHSRKIVHFDLKSANILLSRDFTAKIADVGLARIMQQQFLSTLYCVGTFAWAAPAC